MLLLDNFDEIVIRISNHQFGSYRNSESGELDSYADDCIAVII